MYTPSIGAMLKQKFGFCLKLLMESFSSGEWSNYSRSHLLIKSIKSPLMISNHFKGNGTGSEGRLITYELIHVYRAFSVLSRIVLFFFFFLAKLNAKIFLSHELPWVVESISRRWQQPAYFTKAILSLFMNLWHKGQGHHIIDSMFPEYCRIQNGKTVNAVQCRYNTVNFHQNGAGNFYDKRSRNWI